MAETRLVYLLPESIKPGADGNPVLRFPGGADPFSAVVPLEENPAQGTVEIITRAFSPQECARMVRLGESGESVAATTEKVTGYRSSNITWIQPGAETKWLYHRIGLLLLKANQRYRFELTGLAEPLQYADYGEGGHFEWHTDLGVQGTSGRKLSLSVQISDPDTYDGGALEFINVKRLPIPRDVGTAIVFPSYLTHRVAPVTRGRRRSLVAWAYGPSLR
jgi:PKHD-type hydroxylase